MNVFDNMSLDRKLKLHLAKVAILNENEAALTKIFELDPELPMDISDNTLFAFAAEKQKTKLIPFFMDITDVLATYEHKGNPSPIAISISDGFIENLMAFENCGIDLRQQICFERTLMTPTQLAFHQRSAKSLAYFIEKFGADYTMDQLLQSHGITNEIVRHALNPTIDMDLAELLRDKLGIDFNAQYHYNSETGNALIFVDKSDYLKPDFKFSFKL